MAKGKARRFIWYFIACDCQPCREMAGGRALFDFLSPWYSRKSDALKAFKAYRQEHPSAFVAREVTEAIDSIPQRKPKRKAA